MAKKQANQQLPEQVEVDQNAQALVENLDLICKRLDETNQRISQLEMNLNSAQGLNEEDLAFVMNQVKSLYDKRFDKLESAVGKPVELTRIDAEVTFETCLKLAIESTIRAWGGTNVFAGNHVSPVAKQAVELAEQLHNAICEHFIAQT